MTDENPTPFSINAEHLERQAAFSKKTFGPNRSVHATLDHLAKELEEVRSEPDDLHEWADIIILAFDGALRRKFTPQQILDAIQEKQTINEGRTWPDWRGSDPDKAIFHTDTTTTTTVQETETSPEDILRGEETARHILSTSPSLTETELVQETSQQAGISGQSAGSAVDNLRLDGETAGDPYTGHVQLAKGDLAGMFDASRDEAISRGIQSVRDEVEKDLAIIARTEQTVRAVMVAKSTMAEIDLVKEVVEKANVSEYFASYAIYNLHSRGDLRRDTPTSWFTLATPQVEETLLNLVPEEGEMEVVDLIKEATLRHPGSRVREAYWKLVTEGALVPNSSGIIRRGTQ